MPIFTFYKEQRAIYTETQEFEVEAKDYEKAKTIAISFLDQEISDTDTVSVGSWELHHNSYQPFPIEDNNGLPTIKIKDEELELIIDNSINSGYLKE